MRLTRGQGTFAQYNGGLKLFHTMDRDSSTKFVLRRKNRVQVFLEMEAISMRIGSIVCACACLWHLLSGVFTFPSYTLPRSSRFSTRYDIQAFCDKRRQFFLLPLFSLKPRLGGSLVLKRFFCIDKCGRIFLSVTLHIEMERQFLFFIRTRTRFLFISSLM